MAETDRRLHYGWVVLIVGTVAVFGAIGVARFGYSLLLPAMQRALNMDNTQAGLLASFNLLGYVALAALGGALASHYGPRAVIAVGLTVIGLAMIATGLAEGFTTAALWRGLTGVGSGATNVPVMGLMAAWFAPRRRGLATGIAVTGSSFALILLGPTVPPVLAAFPEAGWRYCWYGLGLLVLLIALLAGGLLRNHPGPLGLAAVGAESSNGATPPAPGAVAWKAVYHSPLVWYLGLVYVACGFSYIIYMTFFVKGLVAEGGYTPEGAGHLFMAMGWASLLCGLPWGMLSDHIGRRHTLIILYLIHTVAFALYALCPTPLGFTVSALLFGLTAFSIPGIMAATCGDLVGGRMAPAALGFITLMFGVGQALGPTVAGMLADARHSLLPAMLLASGVALLGALLALALRPVPVVTEQTDAA